MTRNRLIGTVKETTQNQKNNINVKKDKQIVTWWFTFYNIYDISFYFLLGGHRQVTDCKGEVLIGIDCAQRLVGLQVLKPEAGSNSLPLNLETSFMTKCSLKKFELFKNLKMILIWYLIFQWYFFL